MKPSKHNIFLLVMLAAATLIAPAPIQAQGQGSILFVSPNRVTVEPDEKIQTITVNNRSDVERRYDIRVVDQVMNEQGSTQRMDVGFKYSAKEMLRFVPKRFSLQPGERQTIRVMVRRPASLADGDYHSHMLFREIPLQRTADTPVGASAAGASGASFEIKTLYGLAIPVVVQSGAINSSISLMDVQMLKNPTGPVLAVSLQRAGNAEASAYLRAEHVSAATGARTPVLTGQWVRIYREVDQINKMINLKIPEGLSMAAGDKILVTLSEPGANPRELNVIDTRELNL